jgi:hypothetical protein
MATERMSQQEIQERIKSSYNFDPRMKYEIDENWDDGVPVFNYCKNRLNKDTIEEIKKLHNSIPERFRMRDSAFKKLDENIKYLKSMKLSKEKCSIKFYVFIDKMCNHMFIDDLGEIVDDEFINNPINNIPDEWCFINLHHASKNVGVAPVCYVFIKNLTKNHDCIKDGVRNAGVRIVEDILDVFE